MTITRTISVAAGVFAPGHLGELTQVIPFDLVDDIEAAVDAVPPGQLDVIANYTAFQHIRAVVGRAV